MSEDTSEGHEDDLKGKAKKIAGDASEKASELVDDVKDSASEFSDSAKEAASNVKEEWNKVTHSKENKKLIAGLLAIFLGSLGVHKFVLGYQTEGIILLSITILGSLLVCFFGLGLLLTIPVWIFTVIEGIIYLTKSDEEFYETYQANKKPWL
ncbi:MAG: TM2 domain-containing membrane protein YozV [Flavobacteriales bacterium]|jgi:TM2 domain-containing membrane protein YozV